MHNYRRSPKLKTNNKEEITTKLGDKAQFDFALYTAQNFSGSHRLFIERRLLAITIFQKFFREPLSCR